MKTITTTDETLSKIARALEGLEEHRTRTHALIAAVQNTLSKEDGFFGELQLLDMAEEMLGNDLNLLEIKQCLGIPL